VEPRKEEEEEEEEEEVLKIVLHSEVVSSEEIS
jgi:hypothetical protein